MEHVRRLADAVERLTDGQNYRGRAVDPTKRRKDGPKIRTLYYARGGWVMKGSSACEKYLLRPEDLSPMAARLRGLAC